MKKFLSLVFIILISVGCNREDDFLPISTTPYLLKISEVVGLRLETPFVTESVGINAKIQTPGRYIIKIIDISNKVVSREEIQLKLGDNIIKINTVVLPASAYRLTLSTEEGLILGVTDFNKL